MHLMLFDGCDKFQSALRRRNSTLGKNQNLRQEFFGYALYELCPNLAFRFQKFDYRRFVTGNRLFRTDALHETCEVKTVVHFKKAVYRVDLVLKTVSEGNVSEHLLDAARLRCWLK